MFRKFELDPEALAVESMEIDFAPNEPRLTDALGYQASIIYYTNTQRVPRLRTDETSCYA